MDVFEETWLSTGQAAKIASRDIRTVRRWADTGILRTRISPGGHRQIALSGLLQAQPAPGRRIASRAPAVPPEDALPQWAATAIEWVAWRPGPRTPDKALESLLVAVGDLNLSLQDVEQAIRDEFRDRDERPEQTVTGRHGPATTRLGEPRRGSAHLSTNAYDDDPWQTDSTGAAPRADHEPATADPKTLSPTGW